MPIIYYLITQAMLACFLCFSVNAEAANVSDQDVLKKMPLRKKIGQMFIVGFNGKKIDDGLEAALKTVAPGGLIVFGRNIGSPRQLADLIASAQASSRKISGVPLFVATDQEGGDVIRIKTPVPLPSPLAFGKSERPDLAEKAGEATGRLLKTIGINMNFAPVLDISNPRELTFSGTRTYGNNPSIVAMMGEMFASGLFKQGVLPTGKHFPGHGGISEDSHTESVTKDVSLQELMKRDIFPFSTLQMRFKNDWAIMLAHLSYPKIDPSGKPATFSKPIVTGILREKLGFEGIILTDDIAMAGAKQIKDVRERAIQAVEAGVDMIMVTWNRRLQRQLVVAVEDAVRKGRISEKRIDESLLRILAAKRKFAEPKSQPSAAALKLAVNNRELRDISSALLNERFKRPLSAEGASFKNYTEKKPIIVFSANMGFAYGFARAIPKEKVRVYKLNINRSYDVNRIMHANPNAVGLFYMSGYQAGRIAAQVSDDIARRMLLVTVEAPGHLPNLKSFRHTSGIYLRHPSLGAFVARRYFSPSPKPVLHQPALRRPASIDD